jgi:ferredoxin
LEINRKYAENWPNITRKGETPPDADNYREESGKYEKYFSDKPGQGS